MYRVFTYRGFEIHVNLTEACDGMYDATFQIKGGDNARVVEELGTKTNLRNGPFTSKRAFLVAQGAGQATIDAVVGDDDS